MNNRLEIEHKDQIDRVRKVTWIGVGANLLLSIVKFFLGIFGSSQAVVADAVHSLSDMGTDFAILLGVKYWSAPADDDHPYGHYRIETMITVFIGFILAVVACGIGYKAIIATRNMEIHQPALIAFWGPLLSIIIKEVMYQWTIRIGKRVRSTALMANAWHHRSDAISSIPALCAVIAAAINPAWAFIDYIGALVVSFIILKVSWDIIAPALAVLSDQGVCQNDKERIMRIVKKVEGVKAVHAIRSRKVGSGFHIDLHIQVNPMMTVRDGHEISGKVKHKLLDEGPEIYDVIVHLEPFE